MNLKLCKALRKTVDNMTKGARRPDGKPIPGRELSTQSRTVYAGPNQSSDVVLQLINSPESKRGIYRYLKKQARIQQRTKR